MRFLTYINGNNEEIGVLSSSCKTMVYPLSEFGLHYKSLYELIEKSSKKELENLNIKIKNEGCKRAIALDTIKIIAPIPNSAQLAICVENNYAKSIEEKNSFLENQAGDNPEYAIYYYKNSSNANFDKGKIPSYSGYVERLDYGCELALIIKDDIKDIKQEEALEHIFGYTIINNIIARNLYERHKRPYLASSLDGFFPMGPWITTADEFDYPLDIRITSKVNGELRQIARTSLMKFSIGKIISELSHNHLLKAGTIISTGTPFGTGCDFDPPKYLCAGDLVECEIEKIGKLTNLIT